MFWLGQRCRSSLKHWFAAHAGEGVAESLGRLHHFELRFVVLAPDLECLGVLLVQRLHRELLFVILEKSSQLEVVLGVQV